MNWKRVFNYMSNWLRESGKLWLSCHRDGEVNGGGGGGKKCGCAVDGGGGVVGGWEGLVVAIMFHQLFGPPASICCTGELCNTFPLFISLQFQNETNIQKTNFNFVFVETLRGLASKSWWERERKSFWMMEYWEPFVSLYSLLSLLSLLVFFLLHSFICFKCFYFSLCFCFIIKVGQLKKGGTNSISILN